MKSNNQILMEFGPKSVMEIPKTQNMVKLESLLSENDKRQVKNMPFIIVSNSDVLYLARPFNEMVDRNTSILRNQSNQIIGLSAIKAG